MSGKKLTLDDLLAEDDASGLLDVKPIVDRSSEDGARSRAQFEEINTFVDRHGFVPGRGPKERKISIAERALQTRLRAFSNTPSLLAVATPLDRHGLLTIEAPEPKTLDEILDLDDDLLIDPNAAIFEMHHARATPAKADRVSERALCADFEKFKPIFDEVAADLSSGKRKSMRFAREQDIEAGGFFILNGVVVYVAEVRDPHIRNGKRNARLRLIFENGTEGNNLLRSLATELYKDPNGRRISDPNAGPLFAAPDTEIVVVPSAQERVTGLIYVVKSLSKQPEIASLDGQLFKIGFTTGSLETRIRGAADDPTFLMAPAQPVMTYDAINLNVNAFERLVHHFFAEARLNIEVIDRFGKPIKPREWFLLPLSIIEEAVPLIADGSILGYRYDHRSCSIIKANPGV
jgi:hypothetical protein